MKKMKGWWWPYKNGELAVQEFENSLCLYKDNSSISIESCLKLESNFSRLCDEIDVICREMKPWWPDSAKFEIELMLKESKIRSEVQKITSLIINQVRGFGS